MAGKAERIKRDVKQLFASIMINCIDFVDEIFDYGDNIIDNSGRSFMICAHRMTQ